MKGLHRKAILLFLLPMGLVLLLGLPYLLSGRLFEVLTDGPRPLDVVMLTLIFAIMLIPPIWGYRLLVRIAGALAQSIEVVRSVAQGDYSRTLAAWAAETNEMFDLEQGINATALRLRERVDELREEKSRLEAILGNMAEGVILVDAHKRIELMNAAAEAMFGLEATDALGRDHLEVTHHFDLDQRLETVLRTGQPELIEVKRARPDQHQVLECRLALAGPLGAEHPGVLMVLRDITRFRILEQMRTEFVSNVTHELRTPLTSVRGFAETLLEGALDDPQTARHFVGIIKRESEHLGRLIEDILDLSRIESGKWKMRCEPILLPALIHDTVGRLQQRAEAAGVTLQIAVPEHLRPIPGDRDRLAQVFINLVDNAIKYTPPNGTITVSAEDAGAALRIKVADTGAGMPRSDLSRIFERFYRVDKARSRQTGGTGLGLSIVKHIIDAHGGTIGVESEVGQGTTFTLMLPGSEDR